MADNFLYSSLMGFTKTAEGTINSSSGSENFVSDDSGFLKLTQKQTTQEGQEQTIKEYAQTPHIDEADIEAYNIECGKYSNADEYAANFWDYEARHNDAAAEAAYESYYEDQEDGILG